MTAATGNSPRIAKVGAADSKRIVDVANAAEAYGRRAANPGLVKWASEIRDKALGQISALIRLTPAPLLDGESRRAKRRAVWAGHPSRSLLDFPLQSGVSLRLATREELRTAAEAFYAQADDMRHKARWLALVAAEFPCSEARLAELVEQSRGQQ